MATQIQNFYKTTITRNWTASTGDFNVSVAPTISAGWLVVSPNNATLREIVKYTTTGTNSYGPFIRVSERGIGGTSAQVHTIGETVRMNITAEHWAELNSNAIAATRRVVTTTDDATAVIDVTITDVYELTAISNATTFTLTGTPVDGQKIIIRFKDAGVTKGLTWTGFTEIGEILPTYTTPGKWHYVGVTYNLSATAWHVIAVGEEV